MDRQEAELCFRLISERYEHGSVILSSNKYFSNWGELLSDNVVATALLDRLLHHAHVINIRGQTYRLKDRLKSGIPIALPTDIPAFFNYFLTGVDRGDVFTRIKMEKLQNYSLYPYFQRAPL